VREEKEAADGTPTVASPGATTPTSLRATTNLKRDCVSRTESEFSIQARIIQSPLLWCRVCLCWRRHPRLPILSVCFGYASGRLTRLPCHHRHLRHLATRFMNNPGWVFRRWLTETHLLNHEGLTGDQPSRLSVARERYIQRSPGGFASSAGDSGSSLSR
jgi:hypothetical protein